MSEHISGIDWSGDPGDPRKSSLPPILVIAMAHIAAGDAPWLRTLVDGVRRRHGLPESFVFKHSDCSRRLRLDFFAAIDPVPLFVTVNMVDKRVWYAGKATEEPRTLLYRAIADLVCACPKVYVLGQAIYVDQPKSETAAVRDLTAVVRRSVRAANRNDRLPRIRPRPDSHVSDGLIVQVADMFAGAIRTAGGVSGAELASVRRRIHIMGQND